MPEVSGIYFENILRFFYIQKSGNGEKRITESDKFK